MMPILAPTEPPNTSSAPPLGESVGPQDLGVDREALSPVGEGRQLAAHGPAERAPDRLAPLVRLLQRLSGATYLDDLDVAQRRRYTMIVVVCTVGIVNLVPFGFVAHVRGNLLVGIFDHLVAALLAGLLVYVRRGGRLDVAMHAGVALGGALFLYLFVTGGVEGSGHLWFYTYPLFACFLLGSRRGATASLLLLVPATLFLVLDTSQVPHFHIYSRAFAMRFLPSFLVVLAYSYAFERLRERGHERVTAQNAKLAQMVGVLQEKESDLEEAQDQLEIRVQERTEELHTANRELTREISVRWQTEDALRDANERFVTVLDSIEANVYVGDLETHEVIFANRRMQESFGRDLIGKTCWKAIRGADGPCESCTNPRLLDENGEPTGILTWEAWNPVSKRWYTYYDRAVRWVDGRYVRLQVGMDTTKRRAAEGENARLQQELLQAQKMEAIGTLAGGVAHDLNNILSGVVGFPDLILMELPEDSPLHKPITSIKHSGEKCARIVQDMLTLSRRGVARAERVSVAEVVQQYLESPEYERLQEQYPGIQLEQRSTPGRATEVSGSAHHLSKTLMNLVVNACEAMPDGGRLRVEASRRDLGRSIRGFTTIPEGRYVVLRVIDTGTGISPDQMNRIFEPFYTTKAMGHSGTGLGMAVVWATVQDHQGYVDVRSREGEGTTFELYFPVLADSVVEDPVPEAPVETRGRGETVLVVDDLKEQRELASMVLGRLGYAVDVAPSGEEALAYLEANRPDLMVLDMIMEGGIDGLDTYRRALEIRPDQRAVIVSGFSESKRVERALELGAGGYLSKPYLVQELGATVRAALDAERVAAPSAPGEACLRAAAPSHGKGGNSVSPSLRS